MSSGRVNPLDLGIAIVIDETLGDPPESAHPVAWMARAVDVAEENAPPAGRFDRFFYGVALAVGMPLAVWGTSAFMLRSISLVNPFLGRLVALWLLKSVFSVSALSRAAEKVETPLAAGEVDEARQALPQLVEEVYPSLTSTEIASETVEAVAENITESFVAPWFYYLLFGIPGALAYRAVNTLDDRLGHRTGIGDMGKASQVLNTAVNYLPGRISGYLIAAAGSVVEEDGEEALGRMDRENGRVREANAGWPAAAMSGALGVRLERRGQHVLGAESRDPQPPDIGRATTVSRTSAIVAAIGVTLLSPVVRLVRRR